MEGPSRSKIYRNHMKTLKDKTQKSQTTNNREHRLPISKKCDDKSSLKKDIGREPGE